MKNSPSRAQCGDCWGSGIVLVLLVVVVVETRRRGIKTQSLHLSGCCDAVTIARTTTRTRTILLRNRAGMDILAALH
jgi:hypothetical protein